MKESIFKKKLGELEKLTALQKKLDAASDAIDSQKTRLQADILEYLANNAEAYNVKIDKNLAVGMADALIFKVATSMQVGRLSGKPESEEKWLNKLPDAFTRLRLSLNKQAVKDAITKVGSTKETKSWLKKKFDLGLVPTQNLSVAKVCEEVDLKELQTRADEILERTFEEAG